MPRQKKPRRFEPRYGVSQAALEVEADHLVLEARDYKVLAPADVAAKCSERNANWVTVPPTASIIE